MSRSPTIPCRLSTPSLVAMPNSMLHIPQETCQFNIYALVRDLYLLVWLLSLRRGLSGSLAPDAPGLIPLTSGSAPPTSLDMALKTTSDFTAQCPTPWEVGCVWACSSLGTANSGRSLHSPNSARRRLAQASDFGLWPGGGPRNLQRRSPVGLCSLGECEQLLESEGGEQKDGAQDGG